MKTKLPVIFVTHGSPMLAVEPGKTGPLLQDLGQELSQLDIKAVLVISAHWLTHYHSIITSGQSLETIYDFGGFPRELYQLQYPAKGSPNMATLVQEQLIKQGLEIGLDPERGLDHGAWIPLRYLFPKADIPVMELSIPWPMTAKKALDFGKTLNVLREMGVLIVTSGSMTHNLHDVGYVSDKELPYVTPFVNWIRDAIKNHDMDALADYRQLAPYAKQAHPTDEHLLPLMIAIGATDENEPVTELNGGTTYQALAMDNYVFGQY